MVTKAHARRTSFQAYFVGEIISVSIASLSVKYKWGRLVKANKSLLVAMVLSSSFLRLLYSTCYDALQGQCVYLLGFFYVITVVIRLDFVPTGFI